ncbi:MAG TPA: hypothetical protein VFF63_05775 [Candidatus Babeliales bacterium]|nr:hypothetical protein [Candidatus Babeliales bacterium]
MRKREHWASSFARLLTVLPTVVQIVALVKASPQLAIANVPSSAFDAKTHPYVYLRGVREGDYVGGYLIGERAHAGTLHDGSSVLAVPLESGGSGGVFTAIIFTREGERAYAYAGAIGSGGHLDVRVAGGAIVATFPYYGANDPNCCPSTEIVQTYTIRKGRLVELSEKRFDIPKRE